MADREVVVGATLKNLVYVVIDDNGLPRDITGGSVRLVGTSADLPGIEIDEAGAITDGPSGVATWTEIGTFVTSGDMGAKDRATFVLRVEYTDTAGKWDRGPSFTIDWFMPDVAH